ncbi:hypothetical protein SKAU_G00324450 [Synaphobranchus kaupii]|uniref:Uncharacterized protein n=1 Tax=Synaphobranchus kaupii TaxID=118154 RepID=A0A9Q1EPG5_SYNKA|nr:hypothetical protein SKAU_G00324450 [Synaphobranchus kaupii]
MLLPVVEEVAQAPDRCRMSADSRKLLFRTSKIQEGRLERSKAVKLHWGQNLGQPYALRVTHHPQDTMIG